VLLIATGSRALCWLVPLQVSNILAVGQQCLISSNPSEIWSPQQGTTTFTDTFMMFLHRYVDFELSCLIDFYLLFEDWQRFSSNSENSAHHVRRPESSPPPELEDDPYSDDNSLEEVDATLNNLDDEIDDTEHAQTGLILREVLDAHFPQRREPSLMELEVTPALHPSRLSQRSRPVSPNVLAPVAYSASPLSSILGYIDSRPSSGNFTASNII